MDPLDFSKYENSDSKFIAELSNKGGYITFSNSGKGGNKKFFTLSLESFLTCLKDILNNLSNFKGHEKYIESEWRDLGSKYYTDPAANAQCTVQTKPMFATLSKIIVWANSPKLDQLNPEDLIDLKNESLKNAIIKLTELSEAFTPNGFRKKSETIQNEIVFSEKSIRSFAKNVFDFFYGGTWEDVFKTTDVVQSKINNVNYESHDFDIFKRIFGEFNSVQNKESLTSSNTTRFFEDPIYISSEKYFYFSTQWNGDIDGNYSLTFRNLKKYFEENFPEYKLKFDDQFYHLIEIKKIDDIELSLDRFKLDVEEAGLKYRSILISSFISSLISKRFLILTGLSGSGKTKIAQAFALWICQDKDQRKIIPVGADWTNREPLLGYPNGLNAKEYIKPENGALDLLIEAKKNQDLPYFLILDEMNLSHVERYFADFLSAIESGEEIFLHSGEESISDVPPKIKIPKNLFIIGTVNIDETTHMFSPKVLDRANTIEFRISSGEMTSFLEQVGEINMKNLESKGAGMAKSFLDMALDNSVPSDEGFDEIKIELGKFFVELKKVGAEFGYRSATEILKLIDRLGKIDPELSPDAKLDIAIIQKLLPKLHGSRRKLVPVLTALANLCLKESIKPEKEGSSIESKVFDSDAIRFLFSHEKLSRMYKAAIESGFASFAEA